MRLLYRGISKVEDAANGGQILPKGKLNEVVPKIGQPGFRHDGKFRFGPTASNAARSHQVESGMNGGSCISTTKDKTCAEKFATGGGLVDGWVYVINQDALSDFDIDIFDFEDLENPHEQEVTLMTKDGDPLPEGVIVDKYEVPATS